MKAVIHVCLHNIPCIYSFSPTSSTYPLPCFCVLVRSEYGVFPQRLRYFSWQPDASSTDNSSRPWHCQAFPVCRYSLVAKHKKVTGAWWANTSAANTEIRDPTFWWWTERSHLLSLPGYSLATSGYLSQSGCHTADAAPVAWWIRACVGKILQAQDRKLFHMNVPDLWISRLRDLPVFSFSFRLRMAGHSGRRQDTESSSVRHTAVGGT